MGNMVNRDPVLADLMMDAIRTVDPNLIVFAMPDSTIAHAAARASLKTLLLFLADRAYDAHGKLVARGLPGAVIKEEDALRARVRQFLNERHRHDHRRRDARRAGPFHPCPQRYARLAGTRADRAQRDRSDGRNDRSGCRDRSASRRPFAFTFNTIESHARCQQSPTASRTSPSPLPPP